MVAAVTSRSRPLGDGPRDSHPPAKKAKLSQPTRDIRQNGLGDLINGKTNQKLYLPANLNGVNDGRKDKVDDSKTVVGVGAGSGHGDVEMEDIGKEVVEISSDEEEESDYGSSCHGEEEDAKAGEEKEVDEAPAGDAVMADGCVNGEEAPAEITAEPEEPSFGEMLRANAPEIVDVEATFKDPSAESRTLAPASRNRQLSVPSATSLGTVLTQALRTNDKDLLESCFGMNDLESVRSTIERLPSHLVATLLQKLAERLHKRPGRAGNLMVWVQWSLVAHGGYLAGQPKVVMQLANLNKVLKERASGLQPLLSLKGRLDMLYAQLELRKSIQKRAAIGDEDDEAVIYVEGDEESSSDDEAVQAERLANDGVPKARKIKSGKRLDVSDIEESESSDDEMPTTVNGIDHVENSEDDSEDSEGMLDDEAEETENDTGDDMSEPESDEELDDGEGLSGSDADEIPAKRSMAGRTGLPRRK
ncbi:NUC189-domain-containing protein [Lepidopterella palustris CBS 459.81]|uniref:NUC189-domain-containing protein n=1 Tax=Lepidopterella palustris CBS 459.81 TaxID=1314670 RepID=A0A8E2EKK8_9PEZI|nr:NUC189-domain-containing protein [Lepidopterella palustris CBS 459.81]